jgi:sulfur-carrier protein adenylyltransferase/sulfurtransferase
MIVPISCADIPSQDKVDDRLLFSRHQAFSRNRGLVSKEEFEKLHQTCVSIPGLGGVGGAHIEILARQGIGKFKIADFDKFELANFNRQFGASMQTVGLTKLEVLEKRIRDINPDAEVELYANGVTDENMGRFLNGVDVVVDSLDGFCIDMRQRLFRRAYQMKIPVVTAGPFGFSAALQVIHPDGMSFDEYYQIHEDMPNSEKVLRFFMGLAPKGLHIPYIDISSVSLEEKRGPSSSISISLCAAAAGMEVLKLVLGWGRPRMLPSYAQYDLRRNIWHKGTLWWGNRNPIQRLRMAVARRMLARAQQRSRS